jgi:hypothetical protein
MSESDSMQKEAAMVSAAVPFWRLPRGTKDNHELSVHLISVSEFTMNTDHKSSPLKGAFGITLFSHYK